MTHHLLVRLCELAAAIAPMAQQRLIANQFRESYGMLAPLWGWLMNSGNRRMITRAVGLLNYGPSSRVLEVGFGGGVGLRLILPRLLEGRLTATDLSNAFLRAARSEFASDLAAGRLELFRAPVEQLPSENASFDAVLTVNTIYFWTAPERAMAELHRVLRVGGQLVVAFRRASILERYRYARLELSLYEPAVVQALLQRSGFRDTRLTEHHDDRLGYWCAIARR
jgi:ubiquinone/menaquinone biosynthesis C-methylase UbiE